MSLLNVTIVSASLIIIHGFSTGVQTVVKKGVKAGRANKMSTIDEYDEDHEYYDDDDEEEIEERVEAEMRAVLAGLKPVHRSTVDEPRERSFPASAARPTSPLPHEEVHRRQELEASVKVRAKYLFEAMKKEQEELELRRIEDEIERRVQGEFSSTQLSSINKYSFLHHVHIIPYQPHHLTITSPDDMRP